MHTLDLPRTLVSAVALIAAFLSGCGGGGGGGGSGGGGGTPIAFTPPSEQQSGFSAPTQIVKTEQHGALTDSQEVYLVSANIPSAAASRKLALAVPGLRSAATSPVLCENASGSIVFGATATQPVLYEFKDCLVGGYTFTGFASATYAGTVPNVTSFVVTHGGVAVSGPGLAAGATIDGETSCTVASAGAAPLCVTKHANWQWGRDFTYAGGIANGTYRSATEPSRNTTYADFGASAGMAHIVGSNGTASVIRTGAKSFVVSTTVGGFTYTSPENVFP